MSVMLCAKYGFAQYCMQSRVWSTVKHLWMCYASAIVVHVLWVRAFDCVVTVGCDTFWARYPIVFGPQSLWNSLKLRCDLEKKT